MAICLMNVLSADLSDCALSSAWNEHPLCWWEAAGSNPAGYTKHVTTYTWLEKKFENDSELSREEKGMVQDYLRRKHELNSRGIDPIIDLERAQKMAVELDAIGMRL